MPLDKWDALGVAPRVEKRVDTLEQLGLRAVVHLAGSVFRPDSWHVRPLVRALAAGTKAAGLAELVLALGDK